MNIIFCALFVALFVANAWAQQTIFNNADLITSSSPGGTSCGHASSYDFVGSSRGSFYVGFPTAGLTAPVSSALFFIKPSRCVNSQTQSVWVRALEDPTATFNEVGGINNQCPFLVTKEPDMIATFNDATCVSQALDVTAALNAALAANNQQFVLEMRSSSIYNAENPNFCNRFISPDVEPHYSDNSNCGLKIVSRESFYIVVNGAPTTTAEPTSSSTATPTTTTAPSTTAPTTTVAPSTTSEPTSKSCSAANVSGPNVASPARGVKTVICSGNGSCDGNVCKCNEGYTGSECENKTSSTTTTTNKPAETENISGDNNARAASDAAKVAAAGLLVAAGAALAL